MRRVNYIYLSRNIKKKCFTEPSTSASIVNETTLLIITRRRRRRRRRWWRRRRRRRKVKKEKLDKRNANFRRFFPATAPNNSVFRQHSGEKSNWKPKVRAEISITQPVPNPWCPLTLAWETVRHLTSMLNKKISTGVTLPSISKYVSYLCYWRKWGRSVRDIRWKFCCNSKKCL
jgi:hypothetical protein